MKLRLIKVLQKFPLIIKIIIIKILNKNSFNFCKFKILLLKLNPKEKINSINNKATINLKVSSNNKINNRNYN
jgi:hypothetical protein